MRRDVKLSEIETYDIVVGMSMERLSTEIK
jgi:hypothetical protein